MSSGSWGGDRATPPGQPWGARGGRGREPPFRAPWPALAIGAIILGGYAAQSLVADPERVASTLGFIPSDLAVGRWSGLVTALFIHLGWTHAILNAVAALAFGAPVARLFGTDVRGAGAYFAFYLVCGVVGSFGFALLHLGSAGMVVGASGAVAGLMGAASRLIERPGRLAPFASRTVMGMAAGWIVVNLVMALGGLGMVSGGAPIAWQAHLFGYAAGLLAVGPVAHLLRRA